MQDTIVSFVGVTKTYDGQTVVVDDLNLQVARGEFLTLLGSSGSGKTTSLMMVAGFEVPTSGEILLDGRPVTRVPPYKRNLGVVFQNYALFPHMTVGQNLAFPLEARKLPKADIARKIERTLDVVRLKGYADRKVTQLSGGQQQRIALARALIFDPSLVVMDEPLAALDRQLREALQYEIKRIHKELGISVIYVTHDQGEALTMSDRIAVMEKGRVEQVAAPSDLYEQPATAFVAGFVGENNMFKARVISAQDGGCVLGAAWGEVRALSVDVAGDGDAVCSVRPERILIEPNSADVENIVDVQIQDVVYLGDQARIHMRAANDAALVAKVPNNFDMRKLAVDERLKIGWRAADCRAFKALH
ncbi:ABC transporter ATP-binding protein [Undibacter mobilis]|uniref:Spermidine/putrescine import ATP-binding protein PotA n=1 Tax=Undibacter mobilis TaxID=2292256 RepID=A0A371B792_9BRAD|nr:ABC transporter ATP-binding protein [Undibacter mobilis]RDV03241.1 ABC transporter ATP-binding protein [Undibacter mobilis]